MSTARPEGRFGVVHVLVISGNFAENKKGRCRERKEREKKTFSRARALFSA
jgi:hypothetical protein